MAKYHHIVAAVELDGADMSVVAAAKRLADEHSSRLSLLTVLRGARHLYAGSDTALGRKFETQARRAAESDVRALCRSRHIPEHSAHVNFGEPETAIAEFADKHQADLIVVGAHDRHGLEYFLGTTATAVLHRAHCDVLGVRSPKHPGRYNRIVVGIDGKPGSGQVLERARAVAGGSEVHVVVVVKAPLSGYVVSPDQLTSNPLLSDLADSLEKSLVDEVKRQVNAVGFTDVKVAVRHGTPSHEIKRYLQQRGADLVIMGSGDHIGVGWMIGSTTNNVLHGASCDALVVRRSSKQQF